ncbi:MAG TPA: Glu-tRNA(Gln) amidotransferase subunit GatE [Nitrososphaera sp.]|nr:Glu-tRNA(Gln) amidotransferase subunit GatE [Nitrososphaera sp.]
MTSLEPAALDLKVGFEIHQQLATKSKLFCACDCREASSYDVSFARKLRPTQSELGSYDPAAMFEFSKKMRAVEYRAAKGTSCLVEADEEPPHDVNADALETALLFSLALKSDIMDEIHVMRKIVIDGSNTSGFQRTMIVASGGYLEIGGKQVGVQSICLEEDAAKLLDDSDGVRNYGLDRLGVPLVEIALEPVTGKPEEIMQVALTLGRLLRASKRVARGLGTIRQDVNISVLNGAVVEVKGVQQLDQLVRVIEYEMQRQHGLVIVAEKLRERKVDVGRIGKDKPVDVTDVLEKADSKIAKKILLDGPESLFVASKVPGFSGMIGFEPYPGIRIGKELGRMVKFYGLDGVFHSDELPNYGITEKEVAEIRERLNLGDSDAFVLLGGPRSKVEPAMQAVIQRLKSAVDGVPAETRAATPDGQTVFLRPRPGASRMYPETDIPTIPVPDSLLSPLASKVPRPWDVEVESISAKYGLNKKLASQIFDSDYLPVFEQISATRTKIPPTFVASKLTEDVVSLQRQGYDASLLTEDMISLIFARLDSGSIAKESVVSIFEKLMKNEAKSVDEAIIASGASSVDDDELARIVDGIIKENMAVVNEKGMAAIGMLMGRAMAVLRGKADGQKINAVLKDRLTKLVG